MVVLRMDRSCHQTLCKREKKYIFSKILRLSTKALTVSVNCNRASAVTSPRVRKAVMEGEKRDCTVEKTDKRLNLLTFGSGKQ